ncbi:PfkB family carbohydrate kinase, partial [Tessaracoccus lubricantis]
VPAAVVEAVDSTGAGDAFVGALAVRLAEGAGLVEAARFAVQVAGVSVTRRGAQASYPRRDEVPAP